MHIGARLFQMSQCRIYPVEWSMGLRNGGSRIRLLSKMKAFHMNTQENDSPRLRFDSILFMLISRLLLIPRDSNWNMQKEPRRFLY